MDFWDKQRQKIQLRRASLAAIALLACIVFVYQSFQEPSDSSSSSSWFSFHSPGRTRHEAASAISGNDSTRSKPAIELVSQATSSSIPPPQLLPGSPPPVPSQELGQGGGDELPLLPPSIAPSPTQEISLPEKNLTQERSDFNASALANLDRKVVRKREIPQWRVILEEDLRRAKQEIKVAGPRNTQLDPQATRSIYLNAYKFHKSYELMERLFKVYVYKEGEPRLVHKGPLTGIYSSEGRFIHEMNQNSRFVTHDPQEAHMFFLPYSVAHMVLDLYVPGSHSMLPLATFIKDYVNLIASKHPFWNLTRGSDHFFASCHDWGPATARDHPELRKNSVKVVCNSDLTEEFVPDKDASLPETYLHAVKLPTKLGGPGPSKRPILAFFAGQMHGRVRPALIKHWKDRGDPDMRIYEVLPPDVARRTSYVQHMKSSKFCICAMGFEVNSPRIVESIYYDCVPVLIADNFVLPFSDVLNWGSFSLTVSEKDVPRLKELLLAVSEDRYRKMQSRLKKVRKHFLWHDSAERFDMFHMILHSVWTRRLQQMDAIIGHETSMV
ncbi:probable glycosyltransferase At5g03795 [Selaginella moellendorffii]|uniref:probable glycosyltransferase At5g03795 n=1 Tax=Selaginella moellendorffii TaxID=88036 RepID=UPI000D1CD1CD|nr:probable glycosyltransferase At5g03795 [Selaginella moellendorffii]|eukprot:XP_002967425.2 probable glycosyltransferase At5g03795 [Selaginella moellendorffii]